MVMHRVFTTQSCEVIPKRVMLKERGVGWIYAIEWYVVHIEIGVYFVSGGDFFVRNRHITLQHAFGQGLAGITILLGILHTHRFLLSLEPLSYDSDQSTSSRFGLAIWSGELMPRIVLFRFNRHLLSRLRNITSVPCWADG